MWKLTNPFDGVCLLVTVLYAGTRGEGLTYLNHGDTKAPLGRLRNGHGVQGLQ